MHTYARAHLVAFCGEQAHPQATERRHLGLGLRLARRSLVRGARTDEQMRLSDHATQ